MKEAPRKIYLQIGDHNYDDLDHEEVTWCSDRNDDSDIEYIRTDINEEMLEALKKDCKRFETLGYPPSYNSVQIIKKVEKGEE